jgi:Tn3 transposase DDE domain
LLVLTAILANGINLGLTRMADACPGVSLSTLSRIDTWQIRDETYGKALTEIVNHHHRLEFARHVFSRVSGQAIIAWRQTALLL